MKYWFVSLEMSNYKEQNQGLDAQGSFSISERTKRLTTLPKD